MRRRLFKARCPNLGLIRWIFLGAVILAGRIAVPSSSVFSQLQPVSGPTLGFAPDREGTAIRPILGIPGASRLGQPLDISVEFRSVLISPAQDYAITTRAADGRAIVVELASHELVVRPVAGADFRADLIAISPVGSIAAIYDDLSETVHVLGGLPGAPGVISVLDASGLPGSVSDIAVSDDGGVAIVRSIDGDRIALWTLDSSGIPRQIPADRPRAVAFVPDRHDALVSDDATGSVLLVTDVNRTATRVHLVSAPDGVDGFSSMAVDPDGTRVFLAERESGTVAVVDLNTRIPIWLSCACRPTGLDPLKGPSIFRLNAASAEPIMLLDASLVLPRFRIVPPAMTQKDPQ